MSCLVLKSDFEQCLNRLQLFSLLVFCIIIIFYFHIDMTRVQTRVQTSSGADPRERRPATEQTNRKNCAVIQICFNFCSLHKFNLFLLRSRSGTCPTICGAPQSCGCMTSLLQQKLVFWLINNY